MYSLISSVYKEWKEKSVINIIVIGTYQSGKSTITEKIKAICDVQYTPLRPWQIKPTIGCNSCKMSYSKMLDLWIWDLGGRPDLQVLWDSYINECDGLIFVLDILSFSNDLDIISNILRSIFSKNHLQCIPVLIACNKQDAELDRGKMDTIRRFINSILESMSIREVMIIPCSAYGHQGISEGFHWLVQSILKK